MPTPYIGQIQAFGFSFAPVGWALCNGQLLSIPTHDALFSLLGTIYGGNGRTTFGLPDLRGRLPLHFGQGPGLANRPIGQKYGEEKVFLQTTQIPAHHHSVAPGADTADGTVSSPAGNYYASTANGYTSATNAGMGNTDTGMTGGSGGHDNVQPYQVISWCIALTGIYPSRH